MSRKKQDCMYGFLPKSICRVMDLVLVCRFVLEPEIVVVACGVWRVA